MLEKHLVRGHAALADGAFNLLDLRAIVGSGWNRLRLARGHHASFAVAFRGCERAEEVRRVGRFGCARGVGAGVEGEGRVGRRFGLAAHRADIQSALGRQFSGRSALALGEALQPTRRVRIVGFGVAPGVNCADLGVAAMASSQAAGSLAAVWARRHQGREVEVERVSFPLCWARLSARPVSLAARGSGRRFGRRRRPSGHRRPGRRYCGWRGRRRRWTDRRQWRGRTRC